MRPFIKFLRKSYLGLLLIGPALKVVEYLGNGVHPKGRHGTRFNWSAYGKLIMVGQSHLDAAWRWITKQGILKARGTFKKALDHIDQIPEFTFAQAFTVLLSMDERLFPPYLYPYESGSSRWKIHSAGGIVGGK